MLNISLILTSLNIYFYLSANPRMEVIAWPQINRNLDTITEIQ